MYTGPHIVTDGLVLYLDAANTKSYTSGSTTWNDLSGLGNNGTLTNGPTFSSANGGSIVFDGANDYVNCGSTATIQNISTEITLNVFIKKTTFPESYGGIIMKTSTSAWNDGFGLYYERNPTPQYVFYINNWNGTRIIYPIDTNNINPLMITGTYKTTTGLKLYINGVLYGSRSYSTNISNPVGVNTNIGCANSFQYHYGGNIYYTSIYNKELAAAEVLQNYNATKSRFNL